MNVYRLPFMPSNVQYDIAAHEVMLTFNDDADAELFHEWWQMIGAETFLSWIDDENK